MIDQIKGYIKNKFFAHFIQPILDAAFDILIARFLPTPAKAGVPAAVGGSATSAGGNVPNASPQRRTADYSPLKAGPSIPDPRDEPYRDVRAVITPRHQPTGKKPNDDKSDAWVLPIPDRDAPQPAPHTRTKQPLAELPGAENVDDGRGATGRPRSDEEIMQAVERRLAEHPTALGQGQKQGQEPRLPSLKEIRETVLKELEGTGPDRPGRQSQGPQRGYGYGSGR